VYSGTFVPSYCVFVFVLFCVAVPLSPSRPTLIGAEVNSLTVAWTPPKYTPTHAPALDIREYALQLSIGERKSDCDDDFKEVYRGTAVFAIIAQHTL
jgi:hypothetical protein